MYSERAITDDSQWNVITGKVGTTDAEIVLASGADVSIVCQDLVPSGAYTSETACIAGVLTVPRRVPVARVVEDTTRDLLLEKDCPEQFALFAELVEINKGESNPAEVAVVTRSQARAELTEQEKDLKADMCELGREFDLDSSLFHPGTKVKATEAEGEHAGFAELSKDREEEVVQSPEQLAD